LSKRKNKQSQQNNGLSKASDTEFGAELSQSKKARKKAARERKNNS
jgi:hypothetical protein